MVKNKGSQHMIKPVLLFLYLLYWKRCRCLYIIEAKDKENAQDVSEIPAGFAGHGLSGSNGTGSGKERRTK